VVRWHYQWLIIHEFLVKTVGAPLVTDVLTHGPKHFKWRNNRYIPVEFSVAAYRFGHSQVRPSYRANFGTSPSDPAQQFFALIFDPAAADPDDPADLRGGRRAPRPFIDWQTFFDFGDGRVRRNMKIDTTLSTPLFDLMGQPPAEPTSLATRNLLRNLTMKVPSGQRVAKAMKLPQLATGDLDDLDSLHLENRTPLWFYVLREAEVMNDGEHLGPVGGRIVAEVIVGLIQGDSQSYLRRAPTGRRPTDQTARSPPWTCSERPTSWSPFEDPRRVPPLTVCATCGQSADRRVNRRRPAAPGPRRTL
jgi:hypothetical protein